MSKLERMLSVIIIFNKERSEKKRSEQNQTVCMYVCMYWRYLDRLAQFSFKASLNEGHIKARPQHRELRSQLFANQPFPFSLSPSYFSVSILFTPILLLILSTSLN